MTATIKSRDFAIQSSPNVLCTIKELHNQAKDCKTVGSVSHHAMVECENTHISAVVDVITSDDWVAVVFHPDPSKSVI